MVINRGTSTLETALVIAGIALVAFIGLRFLGRAVSEHNCDQLGKSKLFMQPALVRKTFGLDPMENPAPDAFDYILDHSTDTCTMQLKFQAPDGACPPGDRNCTPTAPPGAGATLQIWP